MKLISWNVNGLRACVKKGFEDFFKEADADIFCIQETKLQEGQIDFVDKPFLVQYVVWLKNLLHGDMGVSYISVDFPL